LTNKTQICIVCDNDLKIKQASQFSSENNIPLYTKKNDKYKLQLYFGEKIIELHDSQLNTGIHVDFVSGTSNHRRQYGGGHGQSIAKAIGLKHGIKPTVLDATAGLARDAFVLATLGCKITLVEQSPVIFTLINDGIKRAMESEQIATIISNITNLVNADSKIYIDHLDTDSRPDVIYIDPMFPERKKTALVKKDMRILQKLLSEDKSIDTLLKTAMKNCRNRVVVKRPIYAEAVTEKKPDASIESKNTRYDIYFA
jgi:16S rRNA (guanine1516-N2)-methyltransferase